MGLYRTDIVTRVDNDLIKQWKALWERAENATIYNSYEWFLTWQELSKKQEYEIIVCFKNDTLVAILPLGRSRNFGIPVFSTIHNEHLTDTAFLMEMYDKETFKQFFGFILKKNIFLQKIDSQAVAQIKKLFPKSFFSLISVNPVIPVQDDPFKNTSHSTLKQVRKTIRNNNDQLRFTVYKEDLEKHLQTMFAVEGKSSKKLRNEDIFSKRENKDFYRTVIKNSSDLVRICLLYLNDIPIAYQYGYLYKKSFAGDQIAFMYDYGKLRPGKTILYFLIEYLKGKGITQIDLGGGLSSYKMEFTDEYRRLYNLYYSPNAVVMAWWKAVNSARRIKQIIFPKKYTDDHKFLFTPFNSK